jgi:hypothetical protein
MIEELIHWLFDFVGVAGVPVGIVASLLVAAHYSHSALGIAAVIGTWTRMMLVGSVLFAILLATGVLDLDLDRLLTAVDLLAELVRLVGELL